MINLKNEYIKEHYFVKDCPYFEDNCPQQNGLIDAKLKCVCPKFKAYLGAKDTDVVKQQLKEMNVTSTEKMGIMLDMQKIFASRFHKIDNLNKDEIDHWTNAYLVCIEDEIVEAEEFLDIYPTRIKQFNLVEFRKELIDILHFVMDGMLVAGMTYENLCKHYFENNNVSGTVDFLDYIVINEKDNVIKIDENNQYLYLLNYILRDIRLVRQCISWKHWKKPSETINLYNLYSAYTTMFVHLVQAFIATGMTSDDIYNVYVSKNIENVLRQVYGY